MIETITYTLKKTGFSVRALGSCPGWTRIIKYKILKNLGMKNRYRMIDILPWGIITSIVDYRYQVSKLPLGITENDE